MASHHTKQHSQPGVSNQTSKNMAHTKQRISSSNGNANYQLKDFTSLRHGEQNQDLRPSASSKHQYASLGKTDLSSKATNNVVRQSMQQKSSESRHQQPQNVQALNQGKQLQQKPSQKSSQQNQHFMSNQGGFNPIQMLKSGSVQMEAGRGSQSPPQQRLLLQQQQQLYQQMSKEDVTFSHQQQITSTVIQNKRVVTNLKTSKQQQSERDQRVNEAEMTPIGVNGVQIRRNQASNDSNGTLHQQAAQISSGHHQRNKFQGSFLANHNSKAGKKPTANDSNRVTHQKFSVSPPVLQAQQIQQQDS